jgi:hypothetical protein
VVESALDQLIPVEFRAALVLELRDWSGATVLAIVLEVQREKDPDKKYSWLAYVSTVRARKRCPTIVLVVAPDADVAAWAEEPIDIGLHRGSLSPLVLGPEIVPEVTDEALAEQETELAIFSAVAHGNGPNGLQVVLALLAGLSRLDRDHAAVYFQIVYTALREPIRKALLQWGLRPQTPRAKIMERQAEAKAPFPPFMQKLIDGGKLEDTLEGTRDVLLRLVARAGIALSEDEVARVHACNDLAILGRWVDNILGAKTAADVLS